MLALVSRPDAQIGLAVGSELLSSLKETMGHRSLLLRRFPDIDPPTTPGEVAALAFMVEQHAQLLDATRRVRSRLEDQRLRLMA